MENRIALLIPAFNEEKYIEGVIEECLKHKLDILIIDDGSTDSTASIVKTFTSNKSPEVILIEHKTNKGKGQALKTGFLKALEKGYSGVITLDADGQHRISEIPGFLKAVHEYNPDIIVGNRLQNTKGMPFIRLATNLFTSWIISTIAAKRIYDVQSGYRFIGERALKNIKLETKNFDTEPEILLKASWMNYKIINIPISTIYHKNFVSHVSPFKDTFKFIRMIFKSLRWKRRFRRFHTSP